MDGQPCACGGNGAGRDPLVSQSVGACLEAATEARGQIIISGILPGRVGGCTAGMSMRACKGCPEGYRMGENRRHGDCPHSEAVHRALFGSARRLAAGRHVGGAVTRMRVGLHKEGVGGGRGARPSPVIYHSRAKGGPSLVLPCGIRLSHRRLSGGR